MATGDESLGVTRHSTEPHDATGRRRAEEAALESDAILRALLKSASEAVVIVDGDGRIVLVSDRAEEMFGYSRDELLGQTVETLIPGQYRDAHVRHRADYVAHPRVRPMDPSFDLVGRRKDGTKFPVEIGLSFIETGPGSLVMSLIMDISERKRAETALRESDERYRALVESAFEGVIIFRAGKILEANEAFAKMYGYDLPEVIGLSPVEMTTPESAELIFNNIQSGFEKPYEITGVRKDGTTFDIEVIGKDCLHQGRKARITAFRDITEIKRAEETRQQAREELEGRVEHQILRRNPYGLTFRELTVLHLVAAGKSDKEIGIGLGISPLTAQKHVSNILSKMEVASRTGAAARALRERLLD